MQVSPQFLAEIYSKLEHGAIKGIADQLGLSRSIIQRELTNIGKKEPYNDNIINAAILRIEATGIKLEYKPANN